MAHLNKDLLIWQRPEWPYFQWDSSALLDSLVKVRHQQGRLLSLATSLAANETTFSVIEKDLFRNTDSLLTKDRLCGWQAALFPTGFSGLDRIIVGDYRKKNFHLGQPPAKTLSDEMNRLLDWWNDSPVGLDGIIRAGIAYFWFMSLEPFEDGNARIGESLIRLALAQDEKTGLRCYNVEKFFRQNEKYQAELILSAQNLNGDLTLWLEWLFQQLLLAINEGLEEMKKLSVRNLFWKRVENSQINLRQRNILSYLLSQVDPQACITNRDCVQICSTSRESIKRDLKRLVQLNYLVRNNQKGRSVEYRLLRSELT